MTLASRANRASVMGKLDGSSTISALEEVGSMCSLWRKRVTIRRSAPGVISDCHSSEGRV
jgi:hypothetical protein